MIIGYTDKLKNPFYISDEDADLLKSKWYLDAGGYVCRSVYQKGKSPKREHLHVLISKRMNLEKKDVLDHINRNRVDNQRENLRSATFSQNSLNKKMNKPAESSGVQGVSKETGRNHWRASITVQNKKIRVVREAVYGCNGALYGVWVIKQKCNKYESPYTLITRYNLQLYEKLDVRSKPNALIEKDFEEKFFAKDAFKCEDLVGIA